uniref:Uncharacterized protein n=1 Tax=Chromera velia CCMP2878 TaxID=1169474 RepID=A0A0G4HSV5_9ALVE|eukprot:Cvel_31184.t1-p1 / transcript=Cvel_31184.t1 / gene=Cvel_31184 / organism=Chromera_velia_CCMP2878 / gene_product=hypothetical protein / transcript_product=hypothetical protein / location=Cvel_scaffold4597:3381-4790(-) / protein_length=395 / sequence_SO=supercontig / SO=protein_coding / is_pseudo=false
MKTEMQMKEKRMKEKNMKTTPEEVVAVCECLVSASQDLFTGEQRLTQEACEGAIGTNKPNMDVLNAAETLCANFADAGVTAGGLELLTNDLLAANIKLLGNDETCGDDINGLLSFVAGGLIGLKSEFGSNCNNAAAKSAAIQNQRNFIQQLQEAPRFTRDSMGNVVAECRLAGNPDMIGACIFDNLCGNQPLVDLFQAQLVQYGPALVTPPANPSGGAIARLNAVCASGGGLSANQKAVYIGNVYTALGNLQEALSQIDFCTVRGLGTLFGGPTGALITGPPYPAPQFANPPGPYYFCDFTSPGEFLFFLATLPEGETGTNTFDLCTPVQAAEALFENAILATEQLQQTCIQKALTALLKNQKKTAAIPNKGDYAEDKADLFGGAFKLDELFKTG